MPARMNAGTTTMYSTVGVETAASHARPIAWKRETPDQERPRSRPGRREPGDRGDDGRHERPRQDPQARLEGRESLDDLEELAEQEDRAEHPEVHEERDAVRGAEGSDPEEPQRQHRFGGAPFAEDEAGQGHDAGDEGGDDPAVGPAVLVAMDDAPHDGEQAAARERQAGQVKALARAEGLVESKQRQHDGGDADGHVDPEDRLPGEPFGDRAAHERPDGDGEAADAAPRAQRDGASLRRDGSREDRQGERQDDGAAEALDGPGDDERVRCRAERGGGRAGREDGEADDEHPAPPEAVAERGAGQEQDGEREGVGVDDPLELLERRTKVEADDRQRGRHDEVVEADHEQGDGGDGEGPGGGAATGHGSSLLSS